MRLSKQWRQRSVDAIIGLGQMDLPTLLHYNLLIAAVASTVFATRPWLMLAANLLDFLLFGVGRQQQYRGYALFINYLIQITHGIAHYAEETAGAALASASPHLHRARTHLYDAMTSALENAQRSSDDDDDDDDDDDEGEGEGEEGKEAIDDDNSNTTQPDSKRRDAAVRIAREAAAEDEAIRRYALTATAAAAATERSEHSTPTYSVLDPADDDIDVILPNPLTPAQRARLRQQRHYTRVRLIGALLVVWMRILAGGDKTTLLSYYFYFINIPTIFARRPITGVLLAGVLLFSHLLMRDVTLVDMWLISTGAGLHLLVMHGYRRLNKRLANACKQRNDLIESLSHEIRTPLHGVLGALEVLREVKLANKCDNSEHSQGRRQSQAQSQLTEKQQQQQLSDVAGWHHTLKESAQALSETLENVMSYSNIQRGPLRPVPAELPLRALLNAMDALIAESYSRDHVPVHRYVTRGVQLDRLTLRADGSMLIKILTAGLSNAIKFSSRVNGSVWIRISRTPIHHYRRDPLQEGLAEAHVMPDAPDDPTTSEPSSTRRTSDYDVDTDRYYAFHEPAPGQPDHGFDYLSRIESMLVSLVDHSQRHTSGEDERLALPRSTHGQTATPSVPASSSTSTTTTRDGCRSRGACLSTGGSSARDNDGVVISIRDSGCGMESDFMLRAVWRPFATAAPTTARPYRGSGLGLYIAKTFADCLGARLRICSRKGRGTLYQVVLPAWMFTTPLGPRTGHRRDVLTGLSRNSSRSRKRDRLHSASPLPSPLQLDRTSFIPIAATSGTSEMRAPATAPEKCEHDYFCRHRLRASRRGTAFTSNTHTANAAWSNALRGTQLPLLTAPAVVMAEHPVSVSTLSATSPYHNISSSAISTPSLSSPSAEHTRLVSDEEDEYEEESTVPLNRCYTTRRISDGTAIPTASGSQHSRRVDATNETIRHRRVQSSDDGRLCPTTSTHTFQRSASTATYRSRPSRKLHDHSIDDIATARMRMSTMTPASEGTTLTATSSIRSRTRTSRRRHKRQRSIHSVSGNWQVISGDDSESSEPGNTPCTFSPALSAWQPPGQADAENNSGSGSNPGDGVNTPVVVDSQPDAEVADNMISNDATAHAALCSSTPSSLRRKHSRKTWPRVSNSYLSPEVRQAHSPASNGTATRTVERTRDCCRSIGRVLCSPNQHVPLFTDSADNSNDSSSTPQPINDANLSPRETCPTPPTTEDPIVSCTDWCPYFEGPSSLHILTGTPPAVQDNASTGTLTETDPQTASNPPQLHSLTNDKQKACMHGLPRPLHRIPSLGVPPRPRGERSDSVNTAESDSTNSRTVSPLALCCDDNPINLRLLLRRMESVGFECLAATSGEEALERARHLRRTAADRSLALVMMDYHLPGIDGITAVRELRQLDWPREPPLCVLNTADTSEELKARAASAGIWEYLTKPFPVNVLREYHDRVMLVHSELDEEDGESSGDTAGEDDTLPLHFPSASSVVLPLNVGH